MRCRDTNFAVRHYTKHGKAAFAVRHDTMHGKGAFAVRCVLCRAQNSIFFI
jgi:LSD1 subclass zinc finger protein